MNGKKCFMTIERCLSPPHLNPNKIIYVGKEIQLNDIPQKLNLEEKTAENYYYTITKLEVKDSKLSVSKGVFDYNEILEGKRVYGDSLFPQTLNLPLESRIKKSIIDLLS